MGRYDARLGAGLGRSVTSSVMGNVHFKVVIEVKPYSSFSLFLSYFRGASVFSGTPPAVVPGWAEPTATPQS